MSIFAAQYTIGVLLVVVLMYIVYTPRMRMQHPLYVALLELVGRFHLDVHMV